VAAALGFNFEVTPNIGLADGIDAVRLLLPRCYFDEKKCEVGLDALTQYRKGFNERLQEFKDTPVHDFSSHGSDSFRGLAVRQRPPTDKKVDPYLGSRFMMSSGGRSLSWMCS